MAERFREKPKSIDMSGAKESGFSFSRRGWLNFVLPGVAFLSFLYIMIKLSDISQSLGLPPITSEDPHSPPSHPIPTNPNVTFLPAHYFPDHAPKRAVIKYGPFLGDGLVSPTSISNGSDGMSDFDLLDITKPCTNCLITWMQAGLAYPNGEKADADTGMWLHHVVLLDVGRNDTVCSGEAEDEDEGGMPERFFASGNERTAVDLCGNGTIKAGYPLTSTSLLSLELELMNLSPLPRPVFVTITYEYIPLPSVSARDSPSLNPHSSLGPSSIGFRAVTPIWLDITGICGSSSLPPPNSTTISPLTTFSATMSPPWTSTLNGQIIFAAGHLHDGGTSLSILRNGKSICDSIASYPFIEGDGSWNGDDDDVDDEGTFGEHISDMSVCRNVEVMRKKEEWGVRAEYDFGKHKPMMGSDGAPSEVMGIAILYVAVTGEEEED